MVRIILERFQKCNFSLIIEVLAEDILEELYGMNSVERIDVINQIFEQEEQNFKQKDFFEFYLMNAISFYHLCNWNSSLE